MRKRVFVLLCTSMFLGVVSCDKDHNEETGDPIRLGVQLNDIQSPYIHKNATRGSEITDSNISDFGMCAFYEESGAFDEINSTPNFMSNTKVENSSGQWSYTPLMYWPPLGSVSFFAYAPYEPKNGSALTISSVGAPEYTYVINPDVTLQKDLLLSYPLINKTKADLNVDRQLLVSFKHVLSSVVFKASVVAAQADPVKITNVSLQSMKNKGVAAFTETTTNPQGWILDWTQATDATDTDYALSIANGCLVDKDIKDKTTATPISATNGVLMLLPQNIDATDIIIVTIASGATEEVRTVEILLNTLITEFELGKKYVFNIVMLSKVNVTINCKVVDWSSESIDVPDFG